jgi:target of rapamycin complex subunit LST8
MSSLVLATAGYDHTIRFWEATTGMCWRQIPHNDSHVNKLEISLDKKWLAAAGNPSVRVYDIQSNGTAPYHTFDGHTNNVSAVGFHKDGRWLFSGVPSTATFASLAVNRNKPSVFGAGVEMGTLFYCSIYAP